MANKTNLNPVLRPVKVGDKTSLMENITNRDKLQALLTDLRTEAKRQAFVNKYFSGLDKIAQEGIEQILTLVSFIKQ